MIDIEIPIVPTAQQRARHTRTGRAYKSNTQTANEATLEALLLPYQPETPVTGAVTLDVTAAMPMPRSYSKKRRTELLARPCHTNKPDLDNLLKQVMDCMTRLQFWADDRQVAEIHARKTWAERGYWRIKLYWVQP